MSTLLADDQTKCSHTPGPWFQLKPGSACIEAPSGNVAVTNLARASVADARLIAAAPELLFALRACADRMAIAAARCEQLAINEPALLLAVDAIAKAEGR